MGNKFLVTLAFGVLPGTNRAVQVQSHRKDVTRRAALYRHYPSMNRDTAFLSVLRRAAASGQLPVRELILGVFKWGVRSGVGSYSAATTRMVATAPRTNCSDVEQRAAEENEQLELTRQFGD